MVLDLLLMITLGFLGSFGHCAGMCGPLTVAFSLSEIQQKPSTWRSSFTFHLFLNLGRILSYGLVGAALGGIGQFFIQRGQLAGIGSELRQGIAVLTGLILIWLGLGQIKPDFLPPLSTFHSLQEGWHQRLSRVMVQLSMDKYWWTPGLLGLFWGLMPCGFLYTAQIKAIETNNLWLGTLTLLAFGLGTMPIMLGVGIFSSRLSSDRRSQLFRLGGWITLVIGILTLFRTDSMVDFTGHGALFLLMLALIARPLSQIWSTPLQYRRVIGVGAFILAVAHTGRMIDHSLNWNLTAISYLLPQHQWGIGTGIAALGLMIPAACTSSDHWQKWLGKRWRAIHLLCVPALVLAVIHTLMIGSHYLGELEWQWQNYSRTIIIILMTLLTLVLRYRWFWYLVSLDKFYRSSHK